MRTFFGFGSALALAASSALLVAACGDSGPESTVSGGGSSNSSTAGSSSSSGGLTLGGTANNGTGGNGTGNTSGDGPIEGCAAANQAAELAPVYLVFLLDESGSMGDGRNGNRTEKWDPVTAALRSFFTDPDSTGIMASLSVFPLNKNKTTGAADNDIPADCNAAAYVDPVVPPTALPNDTTFAAAIQEMDPPNEYGTPTYPALSGTIQYAQSLLEEDSTRKVAIVMVTDGEPVSCRNNTISNTAMAAAAVADQIPTYVIGVGDSLTSLNTIAEGGGTDEAFIVTVDDPEKTRTELLDAINLIRGEALSCDIDIPAPPAGKRLDPDKVNVQFTAADQDPVSLKYGTECSGDTEWRYDDPAKPTTIQLCESACSQVKADPNGKLDVVFGCVNRDVVN